MGPQGVLTLSKAGPTSLQVYTNSEALKGREALCSVRGVCLQCGNPEPSSDRWCFPGSALQLVFQMGAPQPDHQTVVQAGAPQPVDQASVPSRAPELMLVLLCFS